MILNPKSYANWSKIIPYSLWLKKCTCELNTLWVTESWFWKYTVTSYHFGTKLSFFTVMAIFWTLKHLLNIEGVHLLFGLVKLFVLDNYRWNKVFASIKPIQKSAKMLLNWQIRPKSRMKMQEIYILILLWSNAIREYFKIRSKNIKYPSLIIGSCKCLTNYRAGRTGGARGAMAPQIFPHLI